MSKLLSSASRHLPALLPLVLLLASAAAVCAQTVINTVPYTITASGKYIIGTNLNYTGTGDAITINAPNVDLNFDGYYVAGPGNTASTSSVVSIGNVANVTIRDGLIAGSGFGITFVGGSNSRNYTVANMTISRIYLTGINLSISAPGSLFHDNSFSNIGGSTNSINASANAVLVGGGTRLENNLIANVTPSGGGTGFGINGSSTDFAVGNTLSNCPVGIANCKYLDNLTAGCTTPFSGGVNATGNN